MRRPIRGFTAIEIAIVLAVVAVVAMLAAPSFGGLFDRQRVRAAVSNLGVDIQYARSEAVRRNDKVTVSFTPGAAWCYGIATGTAACSCATEGSCDLKAVRSAPPTSGPPGDDYRNVTMTLTRGAGFTIDPRQGATGTETWVSFASTTTTNAQARVDVNALGRVALCSPGGALPGYPTCPLPPP